MQLKMKVSFLSRCFTFGIGSGASSALVSGLAEAGNGAAEFVKEGERMQPKVAYDSVLVYRNCMTKSIWNLIFIQPFALCCL